METGYPVPADFDKFLRQANICIPDGFDSAAKIEAAISEWEDATGFHPFLATDETVYEQSFDPPQSSRDLELRGGLVELISLTVSGTEFVLGRDFFLYPQNAPLRGKPYTTVRFYNRPGSTLMQSVAINAKWGFTKVLPARVREAILSKAAALAAPQLEFSITNGVAKAEDITFASATFTPLGNQAAMWERTFRDAVKKGGYKRVSV